MINPSDMPTGLMPLPQGCKTLDAILKYHILNDVLIASLGCYKDNVFSFKNQ